MTRDFAHAVDDAEMIFSGEITNVERLQTNTTTASEYVVTFKVETWWKGTPSHETRVVWRISIIDCAFFPVGEIGENYLVYPDPSKNNTTRDQLPEVTLFNRTSRLPANRKPQGVSINDWSKQPPISRKPTLNRADATDDIKLLTALRECGCLSTQLPVLLDSEPLTSIQANSGQVQGISACQTCLRERLKPF